MSDAPPESASRPNDGAGDGRKSSFGAWLRHQREARSVSLREIADSSRISLRYLDALEQDRFDVLPAPVFARGFLREYARIVGLDPDDVVNRFILAAGTGREGGQRPEPARPSRARKAPSSFGYGLLLALAVIAFLGIAAALSFWVERRNPAPAPATSFVPPPAREEAKRAPADAEPAAAASNGATAAGGGDGAPTPDASPGAIPADAPADAVGAIVAPTGAGRQKIEVVLSFREDCWTETVVDGRRRASELRAGGETVALEADDYVLLTFGNATAVAVEVNGRPYTLPAGSSRVVRELRIDRAAAGLPPKGAAAAAPAT